MMPADETAATQVLADYYRAFSSLDAHAVSLGASPSAPTIVIHEANDVLRPE